MNPTSSLCATDYAGEQLSFYRESDDLWIIEFTVEADWTPLEDWNKSMV